MKIYVVGTLNKCLVEVLLISTHNIHFSAEIRKYSYFLVEKKKQKKKASQHTKFQSPKCCEYSTENEVLPMSATTYVFMEKPDKYQYIFD